MSADPQLREDLKVLLVESLNLEDYEPAEIPDDQPLFGAGLDLDSIDALELVLALEKKYGVKIESSEESKKALKSINSLAAYIEARQPQT